MTCRSVTAVVLLTPLLIGARAVVDVPQPRAQVEHQFRAAIDPIAQQIGGPRAAIPTTIAIAMGDFDEDGTVDLLSGHDAPDGGTVSIHRGRSASRVARPDDTPFLSPESFISVGTRPEVLLTGDFDGDGHLDVVVATERGATLQLFGGDGQGELERRGQLELGGELTASVAGEFGRPDGLPELVVAIEGDRGPAILVFHGARGGFGAVPDEMQLPTVVTDLVLGQLDAHPAIDLVAAADRELLVIGGRGGTPAVQHNFGDSIEALAIADSVWDLDHRNELSVLTRNGELYTFTLDRLSAPRDRSRQPERVTRLERNPASRPRRIIPLRATGQPAAELLVLDDRRGLNVIAHRTTHAPFGGNSVSASRLEGRSVNSRIVTALPVRLNPDTLSDLVVITADGGLQLLLSAPTAVFTVDSSGDEIDLVRGDGICLTGVGSCTLRAAIQEANAFPGADAIEFDLPADSLTLAPLGSLPIVTEVATIDATSQAGFAGTPIVSLDGSSAGTMANGLFLTGGGIVVRGLAIGAFGGDGIVVAGNGGDVIEGNFIGTDSIGASARPNGVMGVTLSSGDNTIGGTTAAAANLISGNGVYGVWLDSARAVGNRVVGNRIGTDLAGTASLGNSLEGVALTGGTLNRIGTPEVGGGNLISGNGSGVLMQPGSGGMNLLQGNRIGTGTGGTIALGNSGPGVTLAGSGDTVGGATPGAGNTVAHNLGSGVRVSGVSAVGNRISGNSIFSNGGLGIDLASDGVTPNDPADPDVGENDLQNYPVLVSADSRGGVITIDGTMNGPPDNEIAIEFFSSPVCDPSGYGQGQTPLGVTTLVTDAAGDAVFSAALSGVVLPGDVVTATATNPQDSSSEFSACVTVAACSLQVFGQTIFAPDTNTLVWSGAVDVVWVKGELAWVDQYDVMASGSLSGAASLDISADNPGADSGLYYLVRPPGACGSWQTVAGDEPGRDIALP